MDDDGLARVTKVDLRTVWAHEQTGFSRWLVENIDFLNEQLPFDIDPESLRAEAPAGDFSVDVVGDASLDNGESIKVIVENQLEQTDHRRLGQVLTYVAAYGASAAIWISAQARPEHAKAVQWLNDEANIDAWLFDVEIIQIDESRPAPTLTRIVGPSDRFWHPAVETSIGRPLRYHDLRHTHAALLIAQGAHPKAIQTRLGHSSIIVTMDTYGHLMEGLDADIADIADKLNEQATTAAAQHQTTIHQLTTHA